MKINIYKFKIISYLILIILVIELSLFYLYNFQKESILNEIKSNLNIQANLLAVQLDLNKLEKLQSKNHLDNDKLYQETIAKWISMHKLIPEVRYLYTSYKDGNKIKFGLDTAERLDKDHDGKIDHSSLHDDYDDAPKSLIKAFETNTIQITPEPYTDSFGTFFSIFYPLKKDNKTIAILGIDLDGKTYSKNIFLIKNAMITVGLMLAILIFYIGFRILALQYQMKLKIKEKFSLIEQIKKQDESLLQSSKLALIGKLSSSIMHEINNPLTAINGQALMIKKLLSKNLEREELENQLSIISDKLSKGTTRITNVIKNMKNFSKSNEHYNNEFSFHSIITESLDVIESRMKQSNIKIINENLNYILKGNQSQLEQVIINCIINSIQSIENSSNPWIKISTQIKDNGLEISIEDSGEKLSAEILNKMNTKFFTTKSNGEGSGIGLHISKQILENHQGKFYYNNEKNNCCFSLWLPYSVLCE